MRGLFIAALLAVSAAGAELSAGTEARLDGMLSDLLGHGRGRAFVRLVPIPPDVAPEPGSVEEPAALWDRINDRLRKAPPVLPGFPAPRSLREEAVRELVGRSPAEASAASALSVTLVVDDALTEAELKDATDAVARALGLDSARGDTLRASRAPLGATLSKSLKDPAVRSGAAAGGTAGAFILVGLVVVALALRSRAVTLTLPSPAPGRGEVETITPPAPVQTFTVVPGPAPSAAVPAAATLPPLGHDGAAACAELLRDGPAAAADWLLRRATAQEAAAVYARLPQPVRLDAARLLADAGDPEPTPSDSAAFAERVARRTAGLERLEDIVLRLGPDLRAEAAAHLRLSSPAAAGRLNALPLFPELSAADPEDLRLCLSPFSTARLAAALAGEPPTVRVPFLDALPGVAADLVRERLDARPSGGLAAQGEVLARWRTLERGGRVRRLSEAVTQAEASE